MISDKQTKGQKSNELSGLSGYKNTHTHTHLGQVCPHLVSAYTRIRV